MKRLLLFILAAWAILCLQTACGCRPSKATRDMLFTPGSIKFKIIYK